MAHRLAPQARAELSSIWAYIVKESAVTAGAMGDDGQRALAYLLRISQGLCLRGRDRRLPQRLNIMAPVSHPGRLLKRELVVRKLSANRLSLDIGVPSGRITDILNSRRSITADTAVRLGRYFGNSAQFWLDLQSQYDIAVVEREKGAEIAKRVRPADAA
jgi:addiction module HigA family antidote